VATGRTGNSNLLIGLRAAAAMVGTT